MPRKSRNSIKTAYYHIMTQGINKSYIFERTEDIKYYIKCMFKLKDDYSLKIIAYCIMNNHAHLLIKTELIEELSKYMQRLNIKYSHYFNKKYNRVGYVFRDRYKSEGIYDEEHLYNCIRYIYDNPVKAGICKHASEYPYSNYKIINRKINEQYSFIDDDETKEREYKSFIEDFLIKNNIKTTQIGENEDILKEFINILKNKYKISLRKISEDLNINREKIRRIYNK